MEQLLLRSKKCTELFLSIANFSYSVLATNPNRDLLANVGWCWQHARSHETDGMASIKGSPSHTLFAPTLCHQTVVKEFIDCGHQAKLNVLRQWAPRVPHAVRLSSQNFPKRTCTDGILTVLPQFLESHQLCGPVPPRRHHRAVATNALAISAKLP